MLKKKSDFELQNWKKQVKMTPLPAPGHKAPIPGAARNDHDRHIRKKRP
jgi:hypothetical protein